MNNPIQTKAELQETLCDVRNAYRLLKEYQERMLGIVSYIKERYTMPEFAGIKHFGDTIHSKKSSYAKLNITKEMWAWDFLYSYEFEYYLGQNSLVRDGVNMKYAISMLQVSDTGFYESQIPTKDMEQIESFKDSEKSSSLLIFVFELVKNDADWLWDTNTEILDDVGVNLLEEQNPNMVETTQNNCFIASRYSIEDFLDQTSCDAVLSEFDELVFKNCGIRLLK